MLGEEWGEGESHFQQGAAAVPETMLNVLHVSLIPHIAYLRQGLLF